VLAGLAGAQAIGTEDIYLSASGSGNAGGISFADEDIMLCDRFGGVPGTCSWSMFFDGSAEGVSNQSDLTAFHVEDDDNILMAFKTPKKIGGLKKVDDSDIVHFDRTAPNANSAFSFYFDGSDVGLTTDDESIDAIGFDAAGRLIISTDGDYSVPMSGGGTLSGVDADLIVFNGTTGPNTSGDFELYFDGASAGFNTPQEDIWGVWIDTNTDELYLTTRGDYSVGPLTGLGTDILVCEPAGFNPIPSCTTVSSFFVSGVEDYNDKIIDGLFIFNNTPPVAQDDLFMMLEDGVLNGNVLADNGNGVDYDVDGDPLTVNTTPVSGPSDGNLVLLANGNLTYTPDADFNGTDSFEYEIDDGNGGTDTGEVTITITPVNDAPSFIKGADENVLEDAGAQSVAGWASAISAGPANESGQTLTFNVTGNTSPGLFAAVPSIDSSGTLTYTPAADANGSADITIELMDDGGTANGGVDTSAPQSFVINVTAVNDAPSFTEGADETVLEDAGAQSVPGWATAISAGPPDESGQTLTFNITGNTNTAMFSASPSVDSSGTLTYTPAADANGSADITIELMDDGGTANGGEDTSASVTFTINVTAVNDVPSFTKGGNESILEDAGAQSVPGWATGISAGPANEAGQTLTFNVTGNTNANLFAAGPAIDSSGTLTYTAAADANGSADITIELMDDGGTANGGVDTSAPQMFTISVTAVNDAPSFNKGADETVLEDDGAQNVPGWATGISAGPADEAGQALAFNVTGNTNPAMFSTGPAIDPAGTLTYTPAADANGTADITIVLMDNGGTANGGADTSGAQTFTINVTAVNDEPSFTKGADQVVKHDAGPQSVNPWATGISVGPANESAQTPSFIITNNTMPGLFAALPAVSASGVLTFTPELNANGTATITLHIMDDGGTANGGDDTSPSQSFDITVFTAVPPTANNDAFNSTGNVGIDYSAVAGALFADNGSGADDDGGGTLVVSKVQSSAANVGVATATDMSGSVIVNADGSFSYTPPAGYLGGDTFTYTAMNSAGDSQATVTISSSDMIWFIDNSAGAGDGRLNTPFNTLAAFEAVNGNGGANDPAASQCIFVYSGSGDYTGPVTLENNQVLVGQGAGDTITSICGISLAANSNTLPVTSGTHPALISATNAINLASGNTIRGLNIGDTTNTGIRGTVVGTLTISEVSIGDASPSGGGIEVTTSGTLAVTLDNLSANSSLQEGINLQGVSGTFSITGTTGVIQTNAVPAINIDGNPSLATTMTFASVSASGGVNGIVLSNTTGSFTVTGDGSTPGSGGTVQNMTGANGSTSGIGIRLNNTENVALNFMQINDHTNFAIRGTGVSNFDMDDSVVSGVNGDSAAADEGSVRFTDLTGVAAITGSTIAGGLEDNLRINNSSGVLVMTVEDSATPNDMIIGLNDTTLGNDGILLETTANADVTLTIDGVEFLGARGDMVQTNALGTSIQDITIQNSLFLNTHSNIVSGGGGITLTGGSMSSDILVDYIVDNNEFSGAKGNAITANFLSNQGLVTGEITDNTIGTATAGSGSSSASGILAGAEKNGVGGGNIVHTVLIDSNTIRQIGGFSGIDILANRGLPASRAEVNATVTNNSVFDLDPAGFAFAGMTLMAGGTGVSGDHAQLCSDISGNTFDASAVAFAGNAVYFDQISSDANHNLPGYAGSVVPGPGASAGIDSYLVAALNVMTNGGFAPYPGGVDAGAAALVFTANGSTCP
jgi:hypothetical protein